VLDRTIAREYLEIQQINFKVLLPNFQQVHFTATTADAALLADLLPDREVIPADDNNFYGWTVDELVENLEHSDAEAWFNNRGWLPLQQRTYRIIPSPDGGRAI
jgi:hypothetical protein